MAPARSDTPDVGTGSDEEPRDRVTEPDLEPAIPTDPKPIGDGVDASSASDPKPIGDGVDASSASDPEPVDDGVDASSVSDPEPVDDGVEVLLRRYLDLPPVRITDAPPAPDQPVDRKASTKPPARAATPKVEQVDSKLAEIEPWLKQTNWGAVADALSKEETLSPPLALLYAVALRERNVQGDPEGIAIRAVAALLCVPEDSETALVVAKRILRRNPVAWQKRQAPSAKVSVALILVVLVLGAAVGFVLGPGGFVIR